MTCNMRHSSEGCLSSVSVLYNVTLHSCLCLMIENEIHLYNSFINIKIRVYTFISIQISSHKNRVKLKVHRKLCRLNLFRIYSIVFISSEIRCINIHFKLLDIESKTRSHTHNSQTHTALTMHEQKENRRSKTFRKETKNRINANPQIL